VTLKSHGGFCKLQLAEFQTVTVEADGRLYTSQEHLVKYYTNMDDKQQTKHSV